MQRFKAYSERMRPEIEAALDRFSSVGEGCPATLREAMRYSLLAPGKRLRPLLALMAAEACGGDAEAAMPVACAVEMVHAYSLIHDDLPAMDDDDLRRGRPTCHRRFDEATAILAGDALLALAFEVVAEHVLPRDRAGVCCGMLAQAAGPCHLVGGQADDMRELGDETTLDQLESIHRRKTGAMIRCALGLGAVTAGASTVQLASIDRYGIHVGLAFQITDDLLDLLGDEKQVGKRLRKDASHGKATYPLLLGIEGSRRRAEQLVEQAVQAVTPFGDGGVPLAGLAQYVLTRNG